MRWNPVGEWEVSEHLAHRPLVDDTTFLTVQRMRADRQTETSAGTCWPDWWHAGSVVGGWTHTGSTTGPATAAATATPAPHPGPADAPRNVYLREDHLLDALPDLLADAGLRG